MGWKFTTFKLIVLSLTALFFAPALPPHYEFKTFGLSEPLPLEGALTPNSILDKAQPMKLDGLVPGPESVAIREPDEIYTGTGDGKLIRIKNGKVTTVGDFGVNCGEKSSSGLSCGRIAGMRFDKNGKLLLCDVVNGIIRVDVDTGKLEKVISTNKPANDGIVPKFPNDLDIDKSGMIYWSDSTTIKARDLTLEMLAGPSGRLVMYNPSTGKNTVLISNIHFANGVQLSTNEEFVLVAEMFSGKIWRYYLKGKNQGQKDIFIDNLPGAPDNIRPNGRGGFYISLILSHLPNETSPINVIGRLPKLRRFIVRIQYFLMKGLLKLEELFPNNVMLSDIISWVKGFGPLNFANLIAKPTPTTIIVEVDGNGKIIGSLQKDKSSINSISQITVGKEWVYFVSPMPSNDQVYTMKTSDLNR